MHATPHTARTPIAAARPAQSDRVLVGLIGSGIQHSLSPALHEEEASRHGLRLHYQLIDLGSTGQAVEALPMLLAAARAMGFAGLNVTYPCKQAVMPLLDQCSDEAAAMGAVNTVVFRAGRAIGHNTDGSGWAWGFQRELPNADLSRIVLLGAGGAGSAIAHAVLRLGAKSLVLVDHQHERAEASAQALSARYGAGRVAAANDLRRALQNATGLIHATPTGMNSPELPLPIELLSPTLWVSEIVYAPLETGLLRAARAAGCAVCDGGTMAVGQAIGAFTLFTGLRPDAERMRGHFLRLIA